MPIMCSNLWHKDKGVQARMCDRTSALHQEMSSAPCSPRAPSPSPVTQQPRPLVGVRGGEAAEPGCTGGVNGGGSRVVL